MISRYLTSRWGYLFIFILYATGLAGMSVPLTGDQKVYLSIALEMRERGSVLIPFLFSKPNFLKPPLQYWATLVGWKVFGFSLLGALLPSVLALVACGYLIKRLARDSSSLRAIFFAGNLGAMTYGTTAQMEIWIVLFYLLTWMCWLEERSVLFVFSLGVMSWIKGPLYPALWVMSMILYQALNKDLKKTYQLKTIFLVGIAAVLGLSWYGASYLKFPEEMIDVFFKRENFGKMQTHQGTPWGIWFEFLFSLFPLLPWFVASILSPQFKEGWQSRRNFWIAYLTIPALFFTFFPYRVNTYLFLLTPLAVWMMSVEMPMISRRLKLGVLGFLVVVSFSLSFISIRLWMGSFISFSIALPLVLMLWVWFFGYFKWSPVLVGVSSLLLVSLIRVGAVDLGEWDLQGLRVYRATHAGELFYFLDHEDQWHEFGLVSSALGEPIAQTSVRSEMDERLKQGQSVILSEEAQSGALNALQCEPWIRLKRRLKFPVKELIVNGLSIEDQSLHRTLQICQLRQGS